MSVEMTVSEFGNDGVPPPEEPPKQDKHDKQKSVPWYCTNPSCGVPIKWWKLHESVRAFGPKHILCKTCSDARKVAKMGTRTVAEAPPADAPPPTPEDATRAPPQRRRTDLPPPTAHEDARRAPQRRHAGGPPDRRANAPRGLTLDVVELCAFRTGIAQPQVEALLAAIRSRLAAPAHE